MRHGHLGDNPSAKRTIGATETSVMPRSLQYGVPSQAVRDLVPLAAAYRMLGKSLEALNTVAISTTPAR